MTVPKHKIEVLDWYQLWRGQLHENFLKSNSWGANGSSAVMNIVALPAKKRYIALPASHLIQTQADVIMAQRLQK